MEQRDRILSRMGLGAEPGAPSASEQGYRFSYDRAVGAINTASRYLGNISSKRSYKNALYGPEAFEQKRDQAMSRPYARSTYMGKNNG